MHDKPVVVLDPDGLYDHLRAQVDVLVEGGFVRPVAADAAVWVRTVDEAFAALDAGLAGRTPVAPPPTSREADEELLEADP